MFETSATERKNKTQLCNTVQMTTVQTCTAAQTTAWWTVQHCTALYTDVYHQQLPTTTTNDDVCSTHFSVTSITYNITLRHTLH